MDEQAYQFYKFYYNEFKRDFNIKSKLDSTESISEKIKEIRGYIRVYENFKIEENLSKFKIFYACKTRKFFRKLKIIFDFIILSFKMIKIMKV